MLCCTNSVVQCICKCHCAPRRASASRSPRQRLAAQVLRHRHASASATCTSPVSTLTPYVFHSQANHDRRLDAEIEETFRGQSLSSGLRADNAGGGGGKGWFGSSRCAPKDITEPFTTFWNCVMRVYSRVFQQGDLKQGYKI
jgi:hypothetical protein